MSSPASCAEVCKKNDDGTWTIKKTCSLTTSEGVEDCECICTCRGTNCDKCVCDCKCTAETAKKIQTADGVKNRCECTCNC